MTELWRGFANMAATKGREVVIAKGRGSTVWDDKGKSYLDSTASLWYMNVGYGRDEIADAVGAQLKELAAFHTFGPFANPPLMKLADKVAELSAMDGSAVFFTSGGGSDAVDTAAKLARRYWNAIGRPEKQIIVSREHGYHGVNGFGTSLQGIPGNRTGYGDLMPHIENIPWGDADALERLLQEHGDHVAAFIGEPVIGAGGVIPPPDGFWPRVRELCTKHDVLLISDEVICGFGRLGSDFGCQRFGVVPDLMTCAKGLTSGYVPMGAVVVSDRVKQPFFADGLGRDVPPRLHLWRAPRGCGSRSRESGDHRAGRPGRARAGARAGARGGLSGALRRASDGRRGALDRAGGGRRVHARGARRHAGARRGRLQSGARPRPRQPRAARRRHAGLAVVRRHRGRDRRDGPPPAPGRRRRHAARPGRVAGLGSACG